MRTPYDRFWDKVRKGDGCWEWIGAKNAQGYGYIAVGGQTLRAHRVSWELHFGPIPEGIGVCHHCDNRGCARPDHLFLGTQEENMSDMDAKGRRVPVPGSANNLSRLSEIDVRIIRLMRGPQQRIAALFGIDHSTVSRIRSRKTWNHI